MLRFIIIIIIIFNKDICSLMKFSLKIVHVFVYVRYKDSDDGIDLRFLEMSYI